MSRRSEIEEQMAALQAELDAADDDTEVWVEHERGGKQVRTRLSGSHAKGWLTDLFGAADDGDGDGQGDGQGDGDDDPLPRDKKPAGGGYFAKRKK